MLNFILGGCGTGKSVTLMEKMKSDLKQNKQVILLVPEQFSFEAEKRLYDALGVELFNRVKTYSFYTLSQDILLRCGSSGRSYASEQEKLLFLYQAVQECDQRAALKVLYKQNTPDSFLSLQSLIAKIRKEGITAEIMQGVAPMFAQTVQLYDKILDIAELLAAYDRILQNHGLCDNLSDLTSAAKLAGQHDFFRNQQIYLDEFGIFSGDQYQMIDIMMQQAEQLTIAIRADQPGTVPTRIFTGGTQTFLQLKQKAEEHQPGSVKIQYCGDCLRAKYPDLQAVASQIFRAHIQKTDWLGHVKLFQAEDPTSEIEYICAEIYRLLKKNPDMQCRDIAIAVKDPAVYRPLLERAFARYRLPYDIAAEKSVLHTELIRCFLSLLEILSASRWNTDAILKYLKNSFSGFDGETVAMLEHFCFTWSIEHDDWTKAFYEPENQELNQRSEPFGGAVLEALRKALITELQNLKNQCQNADVRKLCRVLYQHMDSKREAYEKILSRKQNAHGLEVLQQNEFTTLWNLLGDTMNTVVRNMSGQQMPLKHLSQVFLMLLKSSSFSVPPETLDSIRVVETLDELMTVRLNSPRVVFAPGVTDGTYPGEIQSHSVFSQQELRQLETQHIKISHLLPELYSDELLIINKILAAPSERLYLTYPEINAAHELAAPSVMIGEILRMFPKDAPILKLQKDMLLSDYAWTKASAYFHFVRNFRKNTPETASLRAVLEKDPFYAARIQKLTESPAEQSQNTSPEMMRKLLGNQLILSPSGVERFYNCPFAYFCTYCLRLYTPEKVRLTSQNIGNFAHYCLEKILSEYGIKFIELSEQELKEKIQELAEIFRKENFSASVLKDSRFRLNYEVSTGSILQLMQHMQEELKKSEFIPTAFEQKIGGNDGCQPYSLRDGAILCKGKIDRVDICNADNQLLMRVIDYKTGKKFLSPEKLADGLDMQMLIYLFALEQQKAFGSASPAGVLYLPSGQPAGADYDSREENPRSREEILQDYYQMKGLLLDSTLPYMQHEISRPASVMKHTQEDILFSMTEKQLGSLRKHVEKKLCEMADRLYAGDTAPNPYLYQQYSPCEHCACADICGHAETETKKTTAKQKQAALETVFASDSEQPKEEEETHELD